MVEPILAIAPMAIKEKMVVLIRTNSCEEACYYAVVESIITPNAFITSLHSSSILLERVLTQGVLPVFIEALGLVFMAELRLDKKVPGTLVVELFHEIEQVPKADRLCPMT